MLDKVILSPDMCHNPIYQIYIERCHCLSTPNLEWRDVLSWFCDALHLDAFVCGKVSTGLISRETNSHPYHVHIGKLKVCMTQIDVRAISDILPALEQRQHMTWGGEGGRGEL